MLTRRAVIASGAGALCWSFSWAGARAQQRELLIGIPVQTNNSLPVMLAAAAGYFKDEGIKARVSAGDSGTNARQQIASGEMLYTQGDPLHPLAIAGAGKPARMLMGVDTRASVAMMVHTDLWSKGVRTVEAVGRYKGPGGAKPRIGITRVGAQTWLYAVALLERVGLADNAHYVSLGSVSNIIAALKTGQIDVAMANSLLYFTIVDEKLGEAAFNATDPAQWNAFFGSNFPGQVIFALDSQIKADPALTQGVVNAVYRAMQHIKRASAKEITDLVQPEYLPNFKPDVCMREIDFLKPVFDYDGAISQTNYDNGAKLWFTEETKVKPQPYANMVDLTFIQKAKTRFG